jgi:hypothetical protein
LKAIGALLTGNRDAVLRNGESKGFAKMIVGDDGEEYEVELRFTTANPRGTLSIKSKNTGVASNNLSMLQKIFGYSDFDAVEFSRWSETAEGRRKQIEVVKSLLPVEVKNRIEEIDSKVSEIKTERTGVNRDLKTFQSIADEAGKGLTEEDLTTFVKAKDITELMREQRANAQLVAKANTVRDALKLRTEQLGAIPGRISEAEAARKVEVGEATRYKESAKAEYERAIEAAKKAYEDAKVMADAKAKSACERYDKTIAQINAEKEDLEKRKSNAEAWLADYENHNPENLDTAEQLGKAELHNKMVARVSDYKDKKAKADKKRAEAEAMDNNIKELSEERANLIANSKLPIEGLTFTEDGLELNGVPFVAGKVSDSQIMEVAAKLIIASNPTVKVFRIARGESLGEKRLKSIIDIAKKNGFQGFIEEVRRGQDDLTIEEYTEK